MKPVDDARLPEAGKSQQAFCRAMDDWDETEADAAAAGLARTAGSSQVFELLYRYGARDFRAIGHKAIYVANTERVLTQVGWRHAEPVVRSLAYALLSHEGENPAQARRRRRSALAAESGIGGQNPRRLAIGQAEPRGDCRNVGRLAARHERRGMRHGG